MADVEHGEQVGQQQVDDLIERFVDALGGDGGRWSSHPLAASAVVSAVLVHLLRFVVAVDADRLLALVAEQVNAVERVPLWKTKKERQWLM